MAELKCPKCGTTFKVDDTSYADILSQVKNHEFERELAVRLDRVAAERKLALAEQQSSFDKKTAELSASFTSEKTKLEAALAQLKSQLAEERNHAKTTQELAVANALAPTQRELSELKTKLATQADSAKLREASLKSAAELREASLKAEYDAILKLKEGEIERLKDLKSKLSTKMIGETLEQHCQTEFNRLRATAFPHAYFEKDNDARSGSKGDYIYREADENGTEIISIMFEMKNESDTTATKHKNEDFFKELDKDRNEKHCEYAILVSLLEPDSELYNAGIVDVSYRFPKMYVIRPQFFIPMISLLRNAAMNSLQYKNDLIAIKNQDIDVTNFERDMNDWKASWLNTMKNAGKKHLEAIKQIDKAIEDLKKTRDALMLSDKHLNSAENKLDDLTIKRLTRGNPTMAAKFAKQQ
ncbi:DUF2130 domain-containing protein [Candidatus Saccharibacteria bacterium]|nr:DUF2130 domain-containing protein [Candidatus Saccharibacteria bacterium]